MDLSAALNVIYAALKAVNAMRSADDAVALHADVCLVGDAGELDSLALITLVLSIERQIKAIAGLEISLLEKSDFDSQLSVFRTPTALAKHIVEKLGNDQDASNFGLQR
jgi:hypothetical protein